MKNTQLKGILFITLSAIFYGSYGVWSKLMGDSFGEFTQGWTRAVIILMILIPLGLYAKSFKKIGRKDLFWFVTLGLMGLNQAPYYYAFQHLSIGTATLLFYASLTLSGYLVGKIIFNEEFNFPKIISFILALLGMGVLFGFELDVENTIAGLMAVLAGLMGGYFTAGSKTVSDNYTNIQILVILFIIEALSNFIPSLFLHEQMPIIDFNLPWMAQLGYSISMILANFFVIQGFKYMEASVGSVLGLTEILFAVIFGIVLFGEGLTVSITVGGIFILIAAALPNMRKE